MASIEELTATALALPLDERVLLLDSIFERMDPDDRAGWEPDGIARIRCWAEDLRHVRDEVARKSARS